MLDSNKLSRRRFLKRSIAASTAGVAAAYLIPSGVLASQGKPGANDRIGIGWIGTGRRSHQMIGDLKGTKSLPDECRVVAVSDVWPEKCHKYLESYEKNVLGPKGGKTGAKYGIHQDYRRMLDSDDVDAVVVSTTEHARALACVLACQAGKDIYAEKPLALTIREGRAIARAVRKYDRVCQVGTQQRSTFRNREACELIRNGRLGKIHTVVCQNWPGSQPYSNFQLATEPVPDGLDWDAWTGQAEPVPFSMNVYLTYNTPGWHNIRRFSGGWTANAGSHALDMVQWALGTDDSGPVEVWAEGKSFDAPVTFRYAEGVILKLAHSSTPMGVSGFTAAEEPEDQAPVFGAIFHGEKGTMIMHRGRFNTKPIALSKEPIGESDLHLYKSDHHFQNWIDSIKSRQKPAADIEIGQRTCTICHLANIARWTGRRLRWDPKAEVFAGDEGANAYLERPRRAPYQLPDPV